MITVKTMDHRGRHQAQGSDIPGKNHSLHWGCLAPYPAAEGHVLLTDLEGDLKESARKKRAIPFKLAHRFIDNAKKGGGVGPTKPSFPAARPGEDSDIRVDIEVQAGLAFV
jgi:hypothetical protein